jgi:hypothetical protein
VALTLKISTTSYNWKFKSNTTSCLKGDKKSWNPCAVHETKEEREAVYYNNPLEPTVITKCGQIFITTLKRYSSHGKII